ncbi:DUF5320 domain-containing protein [bacterium]|nr:DUF5320 domain-containing protein [bacterium]
MPGFDGTGPAGLGPMTGRGNGYCILKKTGTGGRSLIGFAGLAGRPTLSGPAGPALERQELLTRLYGLRWRILMLKQSVFTVNRDQGGT